MGTAMPFGRWPSPLGPHEAGAGRRSRSSLRSDGEALYWVEGRPEEGGRQVVVRTTGDGSPTDVSPPGQSVRSRVHEYGGGAFCLVGGEATRVAFVEQGDQRVHLVDGSGRLIPLSPAPPDGERWAHGDLWATPDGGWVLCVRERRLENPVGRVNRELVAYPTAGGQGSVLCSGRDFYAAPRPDPSGGRLAWTCWDHPDMPWDASEVWVGTLVERPALVVEAAHRVDGGRDRSGPVSVGQPVWDERGGLVYVSDRHGWWQPWRWAAEAGCRRVTVDEAEYHGPDWALGQSTIAPLADGTLACRRRRDGTDRLVVLDAVTGAVAPVDQPCVAIGAVCAHQGRVAWLGATPTLPPAPWWLRSGAKAARPVVAPEPLLADRDVSTAEPFTVPGREGRPVHGLFYAPRLAGTEGLPHERPPLVVHCHGGPTGAAEAGFDPVVQFLTTRGFAVAAVDYAGSTGHGRPYREALAGRWGEADVDDCVDAARHLSGEGRVDGRRMAVRGTSAGGFTALCALARSDVFAAAVTWYAVTDLMALVAATHDFERYYTDWLVGSLPEAAAELRRRSPVHRTAEVDGAVLLLQGLDDPVVPSAQATSMAEGLRARGRRCELITFEGEGHGFRRAETVERCLDAEVAFYQEILCST